MKTKMKTKEQKCNKCEEETIQDVGKKLAHKGPSHYIKRTTLRCRKCGTKEITNRKTGKRKIVGKNKLPEKETK